MYNGSSTYEAPVIRASISNVEILRMIDVVQPYWEKTHEDLQDEYDASREAEIVRFQGTKTFWTRRTRTRAEAEKLYSNFHQYGFNLTLWYRVERAASNIDRLKEIRTFAKNHSFHNITLPEGDLRLVGGPPE